MEKSAVKAGSPPKVDENKAVKKPEPSKDRRFEPIQLPARFKDDFLSKVRREL